MSTNRIMLDLETLGVAPGSVIVAIGAVRMNMHYRQITDEFYRSIDPVNAQSHGLTLDGATVMWWMEQSPEARRRLTENTARLPTALIEFSTWVGSGCEEMWGNGIDFDNVLLTSAYEACGLPRPWGHRAGRCYRTVKNLFPSHDHYPPDKLVAHDALSDARWQAKHLMAMLHAGQCWQMGAR